MVATRFLRLERPFGLGEDPERIALVVGLAALLLTPAVWSGISVQAAGSGMSSSLPVAGPNSSTGGMGGMGGGTPGAFNQAGGDAPATNGERPP
ncbi:MAG: hypothetical protein U0841_18295 [Chloroflexia bacterium]